MANTGYQGSCRLSCEPNKSSFLSCLCQVFCYSNEKAYHRILVPQMGSSLWQAWLCGSWASGTGVRNECSRGWNTALEKPKTAISRASGCFGGSLEVRMPRDTCRLHVRQGHEFSVGKRALAGNCDTGRSCCFLAENQLHSAHILRT